MVKSNLRVSLIFSIGSLCEVESLMEIASVLGYVTSDERSEMAERSRVIGSMMHKLRTYLRSRR
jgi:four helix bundle protein